MNYNSIKNFFSIVTKIPVRFLFLLLVANTCFGQISVGDYRSNVTNGNWSSASSWQICTSVSPIATWSTSTKYPGQTSGTYAVVIQSGDVITMTSSMVNIGTLTINGQLILLSNTTHIINTSSLIVTSSLGSILFDKKSDIKLPSNTQIKVSDGGLLGDCSNNNSIYLGSEEVAVCVGGGKSTPTFQEVMTNGGYNIFKVSPESDSSCGSNTFSFTAQIFPSSGATIKWYSVPISGTAIQTGTSGSGTNTYSPTLSTTTTYYVEAVYSSYTTPRTAVTATVNPQPAQPTISAVTQPDCVVSTGSVVLSGLPSGNWTINPGSISGNTSSKTISGLAVGTYNFTVTNATGCISSATSNVTINAAVTNSWNGLNWSQGKPPTINDKIVFTGNYPLVLDPDVDLSGCSCLITGGANVTIKSGKTLKISNEVTVVGPGTLTFEDTASLVQINNAAVNSGNITYNRKTSSVFKSDYTYWSSPVSNQSLNISSSYESGLFYSYDDFASPENWKKETPATIMQIGKGYIIRGSLTGSQSELGFYNATFFGEPNNGIKTLAIGPQGTSNLLGNPYPSALDADLFLATNTSVIEGTIYIWTHKTAIQSASNIAIGKAGSGELAYTSDDYATYNAVGGVAVIGGVKPTGKIGAGQAFFTISKATGSSVTFNNNMRVAGSTLADGTGVNQQFFKNRAAKTDTEIEKNRIWLNLTNSEGAFKQTLVGYLTDATNAYDNRFDGETLDGNSFVDFYSVNQDKNLTIQGRSLPFDENDAVPLGYSSSIAGDFTINIDQVDGLLVNQNIFIEDKLTNTTFDLKSGDYTFSTLSGTFKDRFVLRYKDNSATKTLATTNFETQTNKVLVSNKNKLIKVNSFAETIDKVVIYDLLGRQMYQKEKVNSNELSIANLVVSHQTLVVKTTLKTGKIVIDKIIF